MASTGAKHNFAWSELGRGQMESATPDADGGHTCECRRAEGMRSVNSSAILRRFMVTRLPQQRRWLAHVVDVGEGGIRDPRGRCRIAGSASRRPQRTTRQRRVAFGLFGSSVVEVEGDRRDYQISARSRCRRRTERRFPGLPGWRARSLDRSSLTPRGVNGSVA